MKTKKTEAEIREKILDLLTHEIPARHSIEILKWVLGEGEYPMRIPETKDDYLTKFPPLRGRGKRIMR